LMKAVKEGRRSEVKSMKGKEQRRIQQGKVFGDGKAAWEMEAEDNEGVEVGEKFDNSPVQKGVNFNRPPSAPPVGTEPSTPFAKIVPMLETVSVEVEVEVTSPSSSNNLKTLAEIEDELSGIEEEIRMLDREEELALSEAEDALYTATSETAVDIMTEVDPDITVVPDSWDLPKSIDGETDSDMSSASTLAREVDVAGEMALRALDVSFLLLEKGLNAAPEVKGKVETAGRRADEALKDGTGEKGWKLLSRVNRGVT